LKGAHTRLNIIATANIAMTIKMSEGILSLGILDLS